ncbi:unnamed protein product [Diatraea saccharalis]|uniref:Uncharacterized protein n=1 Tax=Diatraea saccharalis TaxID=40085 RepID=A0A9N9R5Z1_9NEOP|nr:unnamed protein product [Diatraea saccharalis]
MSKIKRLLRSHNMPLEQIAKRLGEKAADEKFDNNVNISKKNNKAIRDGRIKIIFVFNRAVSTCLRDSCFVTFSADIIVVKSIEIKAKSDFYTLHCSSFLNKTDFYKEPIESSKLGIYMVSGKKNVIVNSNDLSKKCLLLPNFDNNDHSFICVTYVSMNLHY